MQKYYLGLNIGTNSVGWAVTEKITTFANLVERECGVSDYLMAHRRQKKED